MNSDLPSLIAEATRYARFTMKKSGSLAPIMMASTDQGLILLTPVARAHGQAAQMFAPHSNECGPVEAT